jgi:hypothetical protein
MVDKSDMEAYRKQLAEYDANEMAQWTVYHQSKAEGDEYSQREAMRNAFEIRTQRRAFCAEAQAATAQPQRPYVSDEQRAARMPGEMDAYDWAKVSGITPEEYLRQYQRLAHHKATRGDERK